MIFFYQSGRVGRIEVEEKEKSPAPLDFSGALCELKKPGGIVGLVDEQQKTIGILTIRIYGEHFLLVPPGKN